MTRVSKKGTEVRDADWSELVVNIGDLLSDSALVGPTDKSIWPWAGARARN